jgi:hypothetical protein
VKAGAITDVAAAEKALLDLVFTVNASGGLMKDCKGRPVPVGDEEWGDLALVYLDACAVLGKEPMWAND